MANLVESSSDKELTLKAFSWAGYSNMVTASVEQARRVMKFGGLSQPEVAEHLQSSRASMPGRADM